MNEMMKQKWADKLVELRKQYKDPETKIRTEIIIGSHSNRNIATNITKFASEVAIPT